ncbi:MAG: OmpA family protein [Bacteroidetes bacterium]|nr:OmpA family protein [Bacteroidota bacterium]
MKSSKFYLLTLIAVIFLSINSQGQSTLKFTFYFETAQSNPELKEQSRFKSFYKSLDSLSIVSINIKSFCDDRGSSTYNEILSNDRAAAVKNYLLATSIDSALIKSSIGMGEIPLDFNSLDLAKQRRNNRRADLEISVTSLAKGKSKSATTSEPQENLEYPKQKNLLTDSISVGDKIVLENILFEGGKRKLLPVSYKALDQLVSTLKSKTQYHIMILGHVCCANPGQDGVDNDTGIRNLSVVRAQTIYNYLVKNGIDEKRLQSKGMKGDLPTGLGDYYDRRVEIEITSINEK